MLKKYQDFKDALPDVSWLKDMLPNNEQVESVQKTLKSILDTMKDIDLGKIFKIYYS